MAASAEQRKKSKHAHLEAIHHFVPIAVETLGVVGEEGSIFFRDLGRHIADVTQEQQSLQFLLSEGMLLPSWELLSRGEECGHGDNFILCI